MFVELSRTALTHHVPASSFTQPSFVPGISSQAICFRTRHSISPQPHEHRVTQITCQPQMPSHFVCAKLVDNQMCVMDLGETGPRARRACGLIAIVVIIREAGAVIVEAPSTDRVRMCNPTRITHISTVTHC